MSSVKSVSSLGDPNGKDSSEGAILKSGYIRKLKVSKDYKYVNALSLKTLRFASFH